MSDKDDIRDALSLYRYHTDEGAFDEFSKLFAPDGEWVAPYRTARDPAGIAAWLKQSVPLQPKRMHYEMNTVIALDGGEATAKSNYLAMVEGPDGPLPSVCGTCADRPVRMAGGWKFRRREPIHAFTGEMRLALP